jgi:hypothetical protein
MASEFGVYKLPLTVWSSLSRGYSTDPVYVEYLCVFVMQVVSIPEKGSRKNSRSESIQVTYSYCAWSLMNTFAVYYIGQNWIQLNANGFL